MVLCHINFALYAKQCAKISSRSVFLKQIQITSHVQDVDWFSVSTLALCEKNYQRISYDYLSNHKLSCSYRCMYCVSKIPNKNLMNSCQSCEELVVFSPYVDNASWEMLLLLFLACIWDMEPCIIPLESLGVPVNTSHSPQGSLQLPETTM